MAKIVVYGADWCSMTQSTLAHLKERKVDFEYIDIDKDRKAAGWVAEQNDGKEKKPTLDIDGTVLTQPTNRELDNALDAQGIASAGA